MNNTRRDFLADVGRGMLTASLGAALADDLGVAPAWAAESPKRLTFGALEPLVALMQETPARQLLPKVVAEMKKGTDLRTLVAAGSLANARAFGGQDYTGFHTFMALAPAYEMSRELPADRQALPVLKVLYRNTNRIQEKGGVKNEVLHPVEQAEKPTAANASRVASAPGGEALQKAIRKVDWNGAERIFAALAREPLGEAFNHLQFTVQDEINVHRVVLAWRGWQTLDLTGKDQAHTLLRQSVRFCLESEQGRERHKHPEPQVRSVLPKLLDQYRLVGRTLGQRTPDDGWIEGISKIIWSGSREQAADAVAAALAEGMAPDAIGEALAVAANQLVLHDPGREKEYESTKPIGSCHGDSVGVHASDAANAWRNIARVSNQRNVVASLIVGAYHTAGQGQRMLKVPYPLPEQLATITSKDPARLLQDAESAIKAKDQARACALVHRYGELGHSARPVFDLLLRYAISEDGALHAEKYYRTVCEEFAATRPAFRWRQLTALARVTASEFGQPAPGYEEACRLLNV